MLTTHLGKLHKKPHVATPGTGTPCRIHVLHHIIFEHLQHREVVHKDPQRYVARENTRDTNTMGKAKRRRGEADPVGALAKNEQ